MNGFYQPQAHPQQLIQQQGQQQQHHVQQQGQRQQHQPQQQQPQAQQQRQHGHLFADDLQQMPQMGAPNINMMDLTGPTQGIQHAHTHPGLPDGPSLDELFQQNDKELQRQRTLHHSRSFSSDRSFHDADPRRSSMLEFGSAGHNTLGDFHFDPTSVPISVNDQAQQMQHSQQHARLPPNRRGNIAQRRLNSQQQLRRQLSHETSDLSNADFGNFTTVASPQQYTQPVTSAEPMSNFDMSGDFMNHQFLNMDFTTSSNNNPIASMDHAGITGHTIAPVDAFSQDHFAPSLSQPQNQSNSLTSIDGRMHDPGGGGTVSNENGIMPHIPMDKEQTLSIQQQIQDLQRTLAQNNSMSGHMPAADNTDMPMETTRQQMQVPAQHSLPTYDPSGKIQACANFDVSTDAHGMPFQTDENTGVQVIPQYRNAYSQSGFDMLGVLMRVATRPDPQINIGAVDLSCAFVVCDVTQHDIPIVYCSDVFERLTAYTKYEILGRNCRFLQAPDGKITSGEKRKYVDDQSVLRIKNMIAQRQEAQISLINYRKGGQPFMNLLTMIPITWDSAEVKYYVGFQVDLVEQPTSITNKNPDGSYTINYQRGLLPRYVVPPVPQGNSTELGQTVHRDDVSTVLSTIGSGESDLSRRIWDKVLLENTDDVVHVLSLKGLFLYLSPSSRKVLEYEPSELVGTALSSVCHPSDIVPVTRELKDTSTGAAVNVVFRIRRKNSGYTWFESHGSLHLEQGKGRKCIIMVGRERPVYALARAEVMKESGFGESELWTKMSTSGMFLFVSSNVRSLLDRQPDDLVGTSAQALMRHESRIEFGKKLELARSGVKVVFKHDLQNKRGQTLQAQTVIYPGDAEKGQKPTFLVAQTRLLKLSRNHAQRQATSSTISPNIDGKGGSEASSASGMSGNQTPQSNPAKPQYGDGITTSAGGAGLVIGNQHEALASEDNVFDELKTTRSTSWQFELRQMEKRNRLLAEELQSLLSSKKKRKRRNGAGNLQKDCANCHTRVTPEWRRGPSGNRDLCNSCGLRYAKENGRVTPRTSSQHSQHSNKSGSPALSSSHSLKTSAPLQSPSQQQTSSKNHTAKSESPVGIPGMPTPSSPPDIKSALVSPQQQQSPLQSHSPGQQSGITGHHHPSLPTTNTRSPQTVNTDSHNAKTNRMEAPAEHGFGGGIPPKIEEGIEPL